MKMPKCCGAEMKINMELSRFMEVKCEKCGDMVYLKKFDKSAPYLIDD